LHLRVELPAVHFEGERQFAQRRAGALFRGRLGIFEGLALRDAIGRADRVGSR
jgi:hypothetical protein